MTATHPHPELAAATVAGLQERMSKGELSSARLVEMYRQRIEAIDAEGPRLRAVIELNPDADAVASELDRERRDGRLRGLMHGIPILLKDNVDTGDRMLTTAGSLAMIGRPATHDAGIVERLRAAGAVILGKSNLSEWANFRSTRSSSGWSGRGRQTRNPHVLDRSPCGSSSGSAVAVAAGLCAAAVGTETDGSIVCPSSVNGVAGLKPTVGLTSQRGIVPISASQDSAGPHGRTVADVAALLSAMAEAPYDYTAHLTASGLAGKRIGVLRQHYAGYNEHTDAVYERALEALKGAGAELIEAELETAEEMRTDGHELTILHYELKAGLETYLATREGLGVHSLADLIAFNERHAAEEMPYFRQEAFERAQATGSLADEEYQEAIRKSRELSRQKGIDATMDTHRLDALVAPTRVPAWVIDALNGDRGVGGSSQPSAMAGYPIISVPAGMVLDALPIGVSFFGRPLSEALLIEIAHGFEQATQARREPRFLATLELP